MIDPVFWKSGYKLLFIEKKLDTPRNARAALQSAGIKIQNTVSPDLLLDNSTDSLSLPYRKYVPISNKGRLAIRATHGTLPA
jgi:hypothetical protein